jgi:hypothetical protein
VALRLPKVVCGKPAGTRREYVLPDPTSLISSVYTAVRPGAFASSVSRNGMCHCTDLHPGFT